MMRKQFAQTVTAMLEENPRVVVLLGDIGVHAFRGAMARWPERVLNVGVNEQAMVSMGAGLARAGSYPIMHTIDPFLISRAYEQIKVDFGYQKLAGCFVTVGASTDYSSLGCSHHGCEGVALMLTIPGMWICVPGHVGEVDRLLRDAATHAAPTYIRLSEDRNIGDMHATARHMGESADTLVIAVGPTLRLAPEPQVTSHSVLYLNTVSPFPWLTLQQIRPKRVLIIEPFYAGTLTHLVTDALYPDPVVVRSIGVPRRFLRDYGTRADLDRECGLTAENVRIQLEMLRAA